jgi:hypothetical protein
VALAVTFLIMSLALAALGTRWQLQHSRDPAWAIWGVVAVGGVLGAIYIGSRARPKSAHQIERRTADELPALSASVSVGHPYRAALRRTATILASPVSGRWTAALLVLCMSLVAVTLPGLSGLPHWIEAELVLCIWSAGWAALLTTLLYRGFRISDDHVLAAPRIEWPSRKKNSEPTGCDPVGCIDLATCGEALLGALLLVVTLAASWLMVELVIPALFFLSYLLVRGALVRVTNDDHHCAGRFPLALGWGTLWATVYALPLLLAVYGVHRFVH